jgi:hypothetical protein
MGVNPSLGDKDVALELARWNNPSNLDGSK